MAKESVRRTESRGMSQLRKFLNKAGWRYVVEEDGGLRGLAGGNAMQWHWSTREDRDRRFLLFCAFSPHYVQPEKRLAAAEYLTRVNWGLYFGNFEMDWADGQVCLRTCIPLQTTGAREKALEHLVWANCSLMERYLPGLLSLDFGSVSPEQAVAEAERERPANGTSEPTTASDVPAAKPAGNNGHAPFTSRFSASEN